NLIDAAVLIAIGHAQIAMQQPRYIVNVLFVPGLIEAIEVAQVVIDFGVAARPHQHQDRVAWGEVADDEGQKGDAKNNKNQTEESADNHPTHKIAPLDECSSTKW